MKETIKKIAVKVSDDYTLKNVDMNESIKEIASKEKFNDEVIRRICEIANQNTYLNIFNNKPSERGNIIFDLANSKLIIDKLKEASMADNDYILAPKDFRSELVELGQDVERIGDISLDPFKQKLVEIGNIDLNERLKALLSTAKALEAEEKRNAADTVIKISSYCKNLVHGSESLADMSKLALKYSQKRGYSLQKTAKLYGVIGEELGKQGHNTTKGFTKLSSLKVDMKSDVYKPLEDYHQSLMKIAGFKDMAKNIKEVLDARSNK